MLIIQMICSAVCIVYVWRVNMDLVPSMIVDYVQII